ASGQVEDRVGQRAVAVGGFLEHTVELGFLPGRGDLAVENQTLIHVGDVRLVDAQVDAEVDGRARVVFDLFAFELAHRLFQQLHVHLEADGVDLPALFAAQQVPGAADFEIQ